MSNKDVIREEDLEVVEVDNLEEDVADTEEDVENLDEAKKAVKEDDDNDSDDEDSNDEDEGDEDELEEEGDYKLQVKDKKDGKMTTITVKGKNQKDAIARAKKDDRFVVVGALKEEATIKDQIKESLKIDEDLAAIFGPDAQNLSEDFKNRTRTIFEAAVIATASQQIHKAKSVLEEEYAEKILELEEAYQTRLDEAYDEIINEIDGYLTKAINEWEEEHAPVIKSNIRSDIMESFVGGLKDLFESHFIDIPEDKLDVVENLVKENEDLETKLEEEIMKNVELHEEIKELKRKMILESVTADLTDSQKEKVALLAEGIDFNDDFARKIEEIRDAYIVEHSVAAKSVFDDEPIDEDLINEEVTNVEDRDVAKIDDRYMKYFGKHL